ncbi:MAG: hypothetical protein HYZ58_07630 [Acidobacteria bacterium]|nr:hypothetical protein [Acidobacteriota bacterium]MBI3263006.1 hypothetical protein [Acidobacteriota bacterium]
MKPFKFSVGALVAVALLASPAMAGEIRLEMRDGRVTLDVRDATLQEVLAEWARVGNTRIVNAEKLLGDRVTLQLADVPEMRALEIVLRSAAGFVAAPRPAGQSGVSRYDRILVMATSTAPTSTARMPQAPTADGLGQPMPVPDSDFSETTPPGFIRPPTYQVMPAGMQPTFLNQPGMAGQYSPPTTPSGAISYPPGIGLQGITPQLPTGVYPGSSPVPGTIIVPTAPATPVPPKPPGIPR